MLKVTEIAPVLAELSDYAGEALELAAAWVSSSLGQLRQSAPTATQPLPTIESSRAAIALLKLADELRWYAVGGRFGYYDLARELEMLSGNGEFTASGWMGILISDVRELRLQDAVSDAGEFQNALAALRDDLTPSTYESIRLVICAPDMEWQRRLLQLESILERVASSIFDFPNTVGNGQDEALDNSWGLTGSTWIDEESNSEAADAVEKRLKSIPMELAFLALAQSSRSRAASLKSARDRFAHRVDDVLKLQKLDDFDTEWIALEAGQLDFRSIPSPQTDLYEAESLDPAFHVSISLRSGLWVVRINSAGAHGHLHLRVQFESGYVAEARGRLDRDDQLKFQISTPNAGRPRAIGVTLSDQ
ncbi:hypothetical protein GGC64_006357 [Mycobacterium sp. OAS707]|uniref:hypothetical protein n=1 Tax=Mycobacterium sp. OAS707 TaxID=2663822 RepID=UPI0017896170|nr:hypothetical protein [Mycobacterium sp. OAS707]MBE1552270.1 hypothetical protein [Mycobacterium sp. OAS707]